MKRSLIIIASAIVLIGFGVGIYFYFFAAKPTLITSTGGSFPDSGSAGVDGGSSTSALQLGVPVAGAGTEVAPRFIRISDRPVVYGSSAVFIPGKVATTSSQTGSTTAYTVDPDVSVTYIERE